MVVPPGEVLDEARVAAARGDFEVALERYERFFDRALLDQGADNNYYGVRLSYCLSEWARLAEKHDPAKKRLEEKAGEALAAFEETREAEKFHDFQAISGKLGRKEQVLEQFVSYHKLKPELARVAIRFMWDRLVEAQQWDLCAAHLGDPDAKYKRALDKFDQAMEVCESEPSFGGEEFAEQIRGWYVRDVGNLLMVLKNTGQHDLAERLDQIAVNDMQARGHSQLVERVRARAAL